MPLPIPLRLAVRQWTARPLRPILCSIAIAAAVALIVCVGAAFESLRYTVNTVIGQMLGVAEIHIRAAQKGVDARLPDSLLQQLRNRPDVDFAAGRLQTHISLAPTGRGGEDDKRWFDAIGIFPDLDEKLRPKIYADGHGLTPGDPNQIIIDSTIADLMHLHLNQKIDYSFDGAHSRPLTIVGIIKRPAIELLSRPTAYLDINALSKDLGLTPEYNVIDLKLKLPPDTDYDAYAKQLTAELGPTVKASPGTNSRAKLAQETHSIELILSLLAVISSICAALIIGTTLSVGVQERIRQFGQLRCIGSSRSQLASFVLADALVMGVIGSAAGIALGFAFSTLLVTHFPQYFLAYKIAPAYILISIITGLLATSFGAAIPMWQVTRVSPMAAITAAAHPPRHSRIHLALLIGGVALAAQFLLWNLIPQKDARFFIYLFAGIPLIFIGWALLGPAILVAAEWAGAHVLGRLFFIRPVLLRSAWSRTPWRASAMIAALMIGVTLLTAVRARGQSLLVSWVSPARVPDLLLYTVMDTVVDSFVPSPLRPSPERRAETLMAEHPEITIACPASSFPVKIKTDPGQSREILSDAATHFVAVDPTAFPKVVEMEFVKGDRETALKQLADGAHIFVTEDFENHRHLTVGDKLTLVAADGKPVDFTIAAVVASTGMELVKNYFDMRTIFQEQAVSSVLGTLSDAKKYFRVREGSFILVNLDPAAHSSAKLGALRQQLAKDGFQSVSAVELKVGIRKVITRVVDALSIIAFGALVVASLGVANMVIASVHARRYEFGVLRAVGAGRMQLIRLVLAEVSLIGIIAGVLGVAAGLHLAYMSTLVDFLLTGFQTNFLDKTLLGVFTSAAFYVFIGIVITTLLAWLAAILPAARAALLAQRTLLASGRA
ncbi:MAG TPA: FtsX-like permease family protein [Phycisphaerae bacterium]|nr:FtsX-like permease family protein [Phycisphaerae bacterium]